MVAVMETHEPVGAHEALAALASVKRSRARVAWSGYPVWYWLATGAVLGAASTFAILLPDWWDLVVPAVAMPLLVIVAYAASRTRGVCEGWMRGAMTPRDVVVLYGPAVVVIFASAVASKFASWLSIVGAVVVFGLFAGTGLTRSARTARR